MSVETIVIGWHWLAAGCASLVVGGGYGVGRHVLGIVAPSWGAISVPCTWERRSEGGVDDSFAFVGSVSLLCSCVW